MFWQTPWIYCNSATNEWYETGFWQNTSYHATHYKTEQEAEDVNNIRFLRGEVELLTH